MPFQIFGKDMQNGRLYETAWVSYSLREVSKIVEFMNKDTTVFEYFFLLVDDETDDDQADLKS